MLLAQASLSPTPEIQTLLDRGLSAQRQRNTADALRLLQEALTQARAKKDRPGEAMALNYQGFVLMNQGQPQGALESYKEALALHRELKDRNSEANTLGNMGILYLNQGLFPKALETYQQALPLFRALGNPQAEGATLTNIGIVYAQLGKLDKALETYLKALPVHRATGNKSFEANTLGNIGNIYSSLGEPEKALEYLEQTIALKKAIGETSTAGDIQGLLGKVYGEAGQPFQAQEAFEKALTAFRAQGNLYGEAAALQGLATLQSAMGQLPQALATFQQALLLHRGIADKSGEANTLQGIGNVYLRLSQPHKAQVLFKEALALYQTIQQRNGEANTLNSLGTLHRNLGEPTKARTYYEKALAVYRAVGNKNGEGSTLSNIGATYHAQNDFAKARTYFERALPLQRATGNQALEAHTLTSLGSVAANTKQTAQALTLLKQARTLYQAVGNPTGEADALYNLGLVLRNAQQYPQAQPYFQKAVALYESQRTQLGGYMEAKSALLTDHLAAYYHYLELLLHLRQGQAAFALAQKTKARGLLDLLAAGRVELSGSLTPEERAQEQALRQQADQLNAALVNEGVENAVGSKKRSAALQSRLKTVENQLQTLTDTLYARHPDLARKRIAKTVTYAELAHTLPEDTALLEFVVVARDRVQLFVATRSQLAILAVKGSYPALAAAAARFRTACADPRKPYQAEAKALHKALLQPAEAYLRGKKRLIVCPDGALWDVPFAALQNTGGRFLGEQFELVYAYSATGAAASLAPHPERPQPQKTLLVAANPDFGTSARFGDLNGLPGQRPIDSASRPIDSASRPIDSPSRPIDSASRAIDSASRAIDSISRGSKRIPALPGTQREADTLKKLFPDATVLTGAAAQESALKPSLGAFRYLHFATHGFVNDAQPLLSSVILAAPPLSGAGGDDGFLTARELFALNLSAELTVLSACNTARGENRTGEGMIGLTWALFVAGCPSQVVSQWAVDDASTALLMGCFYENLTVNKLSKATALREAESWLRRQSPPYAHPYYWAPFVLHGTP